MAEKVTEIVSDEASASVGGWSHDRIIGEHQQYAFKRLLKLDAYLVQEMVLKKIILKKQRAAIECDYDMNYFLAVIKTRKVGKFVNFLEVLEATFSWNSDHRALVNIMAKYLKQMSGVNEAQRAIIDRVVSSAKESGSEIIDKPRAPMKRQTVIESEPQSQSETQIQHSKDRTETGEDEATAVPNLKTEKDLEDKFTVKPKNVHVSPPKGFIEPRCVEYFSAENLFNDVWTFHSVEHGVTITIHKDSIPISIEGFDLSMHTYLWGPFDIPDEYEICTAILVLQIHPYFNFLKSVSLKFPHSLVFNDDDLQEDFVVLRAQDPNNDILFGTQISSLSISQTGSTNTTSHALYTFSDIISSADYSEDYYVQVKLEHFCAVVGAKRRQRRRQTKQSTTNRQTSLTIHRRRRRKSIWKKSTSSAKKSLQKGNSTSSSRQSSYEGSFDRDIPSLKGVVRQCSSQEAENDSPFPVQLQKQKAIDDVSDYREQEYSNEICIICCSPVQCSSHWTTRFMVALNIPTGILALNNAAKKFLEKMCCTETETMTQIATTSSHYIGFDPGKWSDSNWMVNSLSTAQIHISQVRRTHSDESGPPHIDFAVKSTKPCCYTPLYHEITITGAEASDRPIYFTIKSEEKQVKQSGVIYTQSWLYLNDGSILEALNNANETILDLCKPDHCKLLVDIALQIPKRIYDDLLKEFGFSEAMCDQIEAGEKSNLPERVYKALRAYVGGEHRPSINNLKSVLAKFGIKDIEMCTTDIPLLLEYPELSNEVCDHELCLSLAERGLGGKQWRFVGRYLGLNKVDIDRLTYLVDREDYKTASTAFDMLHTWRQQYGQHATVAALTRAMYRVQQLNQEIMGELWWWFKTEIRSLKFNHQ